MRDDRLIRHCSTVAFALRTRSGCRWESLLVPDHRTFFRDLTEYRTRLGGKSTCSVVFSGSVVFRTTRTIPNLLEYQLITMWHSC